MLSRNLQDYIVVTVMTVLIWVYAEARNVQSYAPSEPVPVAVRVAAKDLVILDQKPTKVVVAFNGAQSELDKVRRSLGNGFQIDLELTEPGPRNLPMADLLRQTRVLKQSNVNLVRVEPQTLEVTVDRVVKTPVAISFNPRDVQLVTGSVRIDPATLPLTAPQHKLDQLTAEGATLTLEAQPNVDIKKLAPGVEHTVIAQVPLPAALAGDPQVRLASSEVRVTFTIDKKDDSYVVPSVPVWVSAPPSDLAIYTVKLHEDARVLKDVKLTGPADVMAKVQDKSLRIVAVLRLSTDDLVAAAGKGELTGQAQLVLPPQVTAESSSTAVRYSVTAQQSASP